MVQGRQNPDGSYLRPVDIDSLGFPDDSDLPYFPNDVQQASYWNIIIQALNALRLCVGISITVAAGAQNIDGSYPAPLSLEAIDFPDNPLPYFPNHIQQATRWNFIVDAVNALRLCYLEGSATAQGLNNLDGSYLRPQPVSEIGFPDADLPYFPNDVQMSSRWNYLIDALNTLRRCCTCTPVEMSDDDVIPFDSMARHKDALYWRDFGGTYPDFAADKAALLAGVYIAPIYHDEHYQTTYSEASPSEGRFAPDYDGPLFNCHAALHQLRGETQHDGGPDTLNRLTADFEDGTEFTRAWLRTWIYVDPTLLTAEPPYFDHNVDPDEMNWDDGFWDTNVGAPDISGIPWYYWARSPALGSAPAAESFELLGETAYYPMSSLGGRWVPITYLLEGGASGRGILWGPEGGDPLIESRTYVSSPWTDFTFVWNVSGNTPGQFASCGLFEYLDGGSQVSPINPYSGITIPSL